MREILFKAKRLDNGEWVEGNLVQSEDVDDDFKVIIIPLQEAWMYTEEYSNDIGFEGWYKVDQTTLCQYTGLVDKNGQKIWENDIVNRTDLHVVSEPSIGFIEYDLENTSFLIHWTNKVEYSPTYHWKDKLQVIGNIFDNAELLEVE